MTQYSDCPDDRRSRLLDALPAIAWSASARTFRFTYVNPAAETLLGYPISRWLEEPDFWMQHLHPEDRHVPRLCHNATLAGRNHELVYRMISADGRAIWLRDYVNVHMVDGEPVELFGVMVDITRERAAEAASRESRENFRRMVELSPDCIGVHVNQEYVYVNQAFVQLLGARHESEIVGRNVLSLLHPSDRDRVRERLRLLEAGEAAPYVREKYLRVDGSPLDVEVAALPLRYGNRDAVQVIARDITDRVRAERALEASEQRYRELVEGVSEILYTVDREGRFLSLSPSFERSTGHHVEDWIGRPFTELYASHSAAQAMEDFQQVLRGGARIMREYELPARSGEVVTVEVSSQALCVDGTVVGSISMARDVTQLRTIARKLEESKRMSHLGQVAASLAHEFNNVLMGIQPFVEVIGREGSPSPAVAESLRHIVSAIARGKRASQEVLRFANPKEPQLTAIDVRNWMPPLLAQLKAALPPSIALSSSMKPGVHLIHGDREHLEQVMTNLVFNARDAISGKGTIHVDIAQVSREDVEISVSDDGPGILPHVLDRIFEPLFTTKRNGTGLGLPIARRLMTGQQGSLTAENRPERGSTFRMRIPAATTQPPAEQTTACMPHRFNRVLLVEDDHSVGSGLETLLNLEGYETAWVMAGAEACAAARLLKPHVAIIDVNLPDGNGLDLIPLLRAEHKDLPVVLSTGHVELNFADADSRIISLMKPYELNDLLKAIANVTGPA